MTVADAYAVVVLLAVRRPTTGPRKDALNQLSGRELLRSRLRLLLLLLLLRRLQLLSRRRRSLAVPSGVAIQIVDRRGCDVVWCGGAAVADALRSAQTRVYKVRVRLMTVKARQIGALLLLQRRGVVDVCAGSAAGGRGRAIEVRRGRGAASGGGGGGGQQRCLRLMLLLGMLKMQRRLALMLLVLLLQKVGGLP